MIQLKNVTYITCGGGNLFQKGESFSPKIYSVYPWVANWYEMEYTQPKPSLFIFFSTISSMYKQTYLEIR